MTGVDVYQTTGRRDKNKSLRQRRESSSADVESTGIGARAGSCQCVLPGLLAAPGFGMRGYVLAPNEAFISHCACPQAAGRTNPPPRLVPRESVAAVSFGMVPSARRTNRGPT